MADISKCFFQVALPREQQDLFRLIWFKNNDIHAGETQIFRFTRHVGELTRVRMLRYLR